jgi:hypothetical protein
MKGYGLLIGWFIGVVIVVVSVLTMCSCTTTRYVPIESTHTEHHWHTDSVINTDSVIVDRETVVMQLDSAAMAKYGIQLKSAERAWLVRTAELERQIARIEAMRADKDTVRDTIQVPYAVEVVKEVEKPKSALEKVIFGIGVFAILGLVIFVAIKLKGILP